MHKYKIHCTEKQAKKALELDAPLQQVFYSVIFEETLKEYHLIKIGCKIYEIPTSEEMIGWLEEMGVLVDINPIDGLYFNWILRTKELDEGSNQLMWESQYKTPGCGSYTSRKEAILSAIGAALEYLTNKTMEE